MTRVYLGLGSNLGDRYGRLIEALDRLQAHVAIDAISSIYETEPWGYSDQPRFLKLEDRFLVDQFPLLIAQSLDLVAGEQAVGARQEQSDEKHGCRTTGGNHFPTTARSDGIGLAHHARVVNMLHIEIDVFVRDGPQTIDVRGSAFLHERFGFRGRSPRRDNACEECCQCCHLIPSIHFQRTQLRAAGGRVSLYFYFGWRHHVFGKNAGPALA